MGYSTSELRRIGQQLNRSGKSLTIGNETSEINNFFLNQNHLRMPLTDQEARIVKDYYYEDMVNYQSYKKDSGSKSLAEFGFFAIFVALFFGIEAFFRFTKRKYVFPIMMFLYTLLFVTCWPVARLIIGYPIIAWLVLPLILMGIGIGLSFLAYRIDLNVLKKAQGRTDRYMKFSMVPLLALNVFLLLISKYVYWYDYIPLIVLTFTCIAFFFAKRDLAKATMIVYFVLEYVRIVMSMVTTGVGRYDVYYMVQNTIFAGLFLVANGYLNGKIKKYSKADNAWNTIIDLIFIAIFFIFIDNVFYYNRFVYGSHEIMDFVGFFRNGMYPCLMMFNILGFINLGKFARLR